MLLQLLSWSCRSHEYVRPVISSPASDPLRIEDSLRVLELVENECFEESLEEIHTLSTRHTRDQDLHILQELLGLWIEMKSQCAERERCSLSQVEAGAPREEFVECGPPWIRGPAQVKDWERLKEKGRQLYSDGKIEDALACWREVVAALPGDEEARQLVRRAETVLARTEAR